MYYANGSGIRIRNTGAVVDSVLIAGATDVEAKPSPDNSALALAYRQGNSTNLVLVDAASGNVTTVHTASGGGFYTFAWAPGSDALGAGYRPSGAAERSAVVIADLSGNVRNVGCSMSNRFVAWRANEQVVVGDGSNIYTVSARDCTTLATLPRNGKTDITFSPDGSRVLFKRANSLFIARYDGASTTQIAAPRSRANNMRWSPDSRKIAFEIQSPRYGNVTHVAVYDYATGQATFNTEEKPLGVPKDNNPCWSPDGTRLSLDRSYARSGEAGDYVQQQKVVTRVPGNDENVVAEELVRGAASEGRDDCSWVDDEHLALMSTDGPKIVNVDTKVAYRMPSNVKLLYARVAN
jgi:dipeptidyl aminopeptidase/acylaminoacyl peptidase